MSLFIHTDVTAVKLYQNFILAGIGSSVSIFEKNSLERLERLKCLKAQKIYGFVPLKGTSKILVFGGKQYTVISLKSFEDTNDGIEVYRLFEVKECDDWLHSATWLNIYEVGLLTAHNSVQIWDTDSQIIVTKHLSSENSILYSGLLLPLQDGLLVFAGTVFSEIIVHIPGDKKALHHLKGHRGVIFSISCYPEKQVIVSTSDDRSVRIWAIDAEKQFNFAYNTSDYWNNVSIVCKHEVYGHTARVMRSCITEDLVISVGEDSSLCYWDYKGKLLRKNLTHHNSGIWSVDADNRYIVTGGGSGAVILHPMTGAIECGIQECLKVKTNTPKKLAFTARRNLVVLDESGAAIHYVDVVGKTTDTYQLKHGSGNRYLCVSSCKQMIAVANMSGKLEVFIENCKDDARLRSIIKTDLNIGTIFSMQWVGNRHLVFCAENGLITVLCSSKSEVDIYANFILPACKERWLTTAALHSNNNILIVGDRCGNVHVYDKGHKHPIKTFNKVHGRYGPTSITITQDGFITTGRDGSLKYFSLDENECSLAKFMSSKDLDFQWAEKFIDREYNVICGFKERIFVIYNVKDNLNLLEVPCGGGHRTWDVIRYIDKEDEEYEEFIRLVYVKSNDIFTHTFQMSKIVSRNVLSSTHSKEINCMKSFKSEDGSISFYVTGGEDTTLRISTLSSQKIFRNEAVFKHLSNVRTVKIFEDKDKVIVVSGGGRAQICIKLIDLRKNGEHLLSSQELVSYLIKGTDKQRKNNQTWRDNSIDFDPETRIMDLDLIKLEGGKFLIFACCSDACLRVFLFDFECDATTLHPVAELWHHKTCILKTTCLKFLDKDILVTCTTRGEVCLWDVTNISTWEHYSPFFTMTTNKCGINSLHTQVLDDKLMIVTGGDDNAVHLNVLEVPDMVLSSTRVKYKWSTDRFHCSQVTGAKLVDDYLLTTSIDQRVTLSKWKVEGKGIECEFVSQMYSDIADIQGMDILSHSSDVITVSVFGKGLEVIAMPKRPPQ